MALCKCAVSSRLISARPCQVWASLSSRTFFSRKKNEDQNVEGEVGEGPGEGEERRKIREGDGFLTRERLNTLAAKTRTLTTRRSYRAPPDVEGRIEGVLRQVYRGEVREDWQSTPLTDPRLKYNLLSRLITEFDHDMSSMTLNDVTTVQDAVTYFMTDVRQTSTLEDLKTLDLPENLHIQTEAIRYDPDTDVMFGGRTAFPGAESTVTSIKYRRKYETYKTTKVKPGYENHYYNY